MGMDLEKIEQGVRLILEGVGEDPNREGLLKLPRALLACTRNVLQGSMRIPLNILKPPLMSIMKKWYWCVIFPSILCANIIWLHFLV